MAGFVKAQRQRVHIKIAVTGPSGSGKTYSALRMAFGLAGKAGRVAFIDTENGSGSLYADLGDYDVMEITAPFTAQKYVSAINDAVAAGYEVLIIDSLSHVWAGDGGLLDQKSARDARGGNSFSNWADVTKLHEQLKSALLQSPIHLIATMRSKQDYVLDQGQNGKSTPRKVGLAPIQRDGMEYEFTTVFDVDMSHTAATSKDRTGLFTDEVSQITEQHGQRLKGWLAGGAAQVPAPPPHEAQQFREARQSEARQPQEARPRPAQQVSEPATTTEDRLKAERLEKAAPLLSLLQTLPKDVRDGYRAGWKEKYGTDNAKMLNFDVMESELTRIKSEQFGGDEIKGETEEDPFAGEPALMVINAQGTVPGHGD